MEIHPTLKEALEKINFLERYRYLSEEYRDFENRFETYENMLAMDIINSLGYSASYNKKENFFKILEQVGEFQIQLNIVLKGGIVELIWDLKKNGVRLPLAYGSWGSIGKTLSDGNTIKKPVFSSYEHLKSILDLTFSIHEDFKRTITRKENAANE